jgi:hypothetical protein
MPVIVKNDQFLDIVIKRKMKNSMISSKSVNPCYRHKLQTSSILGYCLNWARILNIIINDVKGITRVYRLNMLND